MGRTVIKVENISKYYNLGYINSGSLINDFLILSARIRGKENPFQIIGENSSKAIVGDLLWALRDINLEVKEGEILGIIGSNGAGKSTLLKILSRVTGPSSGIIKVKGRMGTLLEIGTGFHPELSGRENVFLNGSILGMQKWEIQKRFDEIVEFSGVEKHIDTPVKRYSSGMHVRLGFAIAAHLDPEILIIDEVLAVGDAAFQQKCIGKMSSVAKQGRTVLFVSHNMSSIKSLCDRAILIEAGKIIENGNVEAVVDKYIEKSLVSVSPSKSIRKFKYRNNPLNEFEFVDQVSLFNREKEATSVYLMDDFLEVEIECSRLNKYSNTQIRIYFKLKESRIITFDTELQKREKFIFSKKDIISLKIPELNLFPGNYIVDVEIIQKGGRKIDFIENAISFTVIPSKELGKDYQLSSKEGGTYSKNGVWELSNI